MATIPQSDIGEDALVAVGAPPFADAIPTADSPTIRMLERIGRALAAVGVALMLLAAAATVIDVTMRWFAHSAVLALNEITSLAFAVAIASTLPAGLFAGINLKIDVCARWMAIRTRTLLAALGDVSLLVFFVILAYEIMIFANTLQEQRRTTVILQWQVAPFMYCVVILLVITSAFQAVITWRTIRKALTADRNEPFPLLAVIVGFASVLLLIYGFFTFPAVMNWAQQNVGTTVLVAFASLWLLMLVLMPLATVTGLVGILGAASLIGWNPALSAFASEATGLLTNSQMATLPLFLMMGSFAAVSGMAQDLYRLAHVVFSRFRGGLALATIGSCAGFGALTGSSIATAATIGRVAIPEMTARGYSPALATGTCAAGGTLGPLVPPGSGPLIVFALLTEASIGQLFVASVGPAVLAVALYFLTIMIYVRIAPRSAPPPTRDLDQQELRSSLRRCIPVGLLVFGVMGGLYFGVFTDVESAAVGAIGAFLAAAFRGKLNRKAYLEVMAETTATTAMIYTLIIGAQILSLFVGVSGLAESMTSYLSGLHWNPLALMAMILAGYLLLGAVMESFAVMIITVPVITPLITSLGYNVIWWGVAMLCVVETGLIHPPFGINVFVLKALSPSTSMWTIYKGVTPFVVADLVKLALMTLFPWIALALVPGMKH
jgi:tripartite ATP-independent transporter DctM subunit